MTPQGDRRDPGSLPQGKRAKRMALRVGAIGPRLGHGGARRCDPR
jgi:hypothetical protein